MVGGLVVWSVGCALLVFHPNHSPKPPKPHTFYPPLVFKSVAPSWAQVKAGGGDWVVGWLVGWLVGWNSEGCGRDTYYPQG